MTVKEVMERLSITETGRAVAYIKDGLEEIEMYTKENVLSGKKGSLTTSNTISFQKSLANSFLYENDWSGASTSDGQTTLPTGWTVQDAGGGDPPEFRRISGDGTGTTYALQIKLVTNLNVEGMYRTYTVIPGIQYNIKFDRKFSSGTGYVTIGTTAGNGDFYSNFANGDSEFVEVTGTFTPTVSTIYITVFIGAGESTGDLIALHQTIQMKQTTPLMDTIL